MSPFAMGKQVFMSEPSAYSFEQCALWHSKYGHIFSGHDFMVFGRYVPRGAEQAKIVDLYSFEGQECDCLHVALCVGSMASAWATLPKEVKWISYERQNCLRFFPLDRIKRFSSVLSRYEKSFFPPTSAFV